jgi:hypothetical protein
MTDYMDYQAAFDWLVSQEGVVMTDSRAKTILGFALDAGRCPASDTDWIEFLAGEGFSVRRDPVGIRRWQEHARGRAGGAS